MPDHIRENAKKSVYVLVFDGLADWEPAHAICELRRSGKFNVVTVGFSSETVTTMGGLRVIPDLTLEQLELHDAALFILPGGDMWEQNEHGGVRTLLRRCHASHVPVAAICGATLEIARSGLTAGVRHTSNGLSYLQSMVPEYHDEALYIDELAVCDNGIITASGLGSVEFAREIFRVLHVYDEKDLSTWFDMFKHGMIPANMA
jgi:putative intracellular protease/amidase